MQTPFRKMISLGTNRKIPRNLFNSIFFDLFEYFAENKTERSVEDVKFIFKSLTKKYRREIKILTDSDKEELREEMEKQGENFIEKHKEQINTLEDNSYIREMTPYWIYNFGLALSILSETLDKERRVSFHEGRRSLTSTRERGTLFERIIYASFLVLYRILEQNYLLMTNQEFDKDKEIDLLIKDVVQLKNITRMIR